MEIKPDILSMDQEEREEGELSDEELEDVSDSSISLVSLMLSGTTVAGREPFKELSLTSVSDELSDNSVIEIANVKTPSVVKESSKNMYRGQCRHRRTKKDSSVKKIKYSRKQTKTKSTDWQKQCDDFSSSSSDSHEFIPNPKVLRQLRDAVRISSSKKYPNCSLRSRLKRMIQPENQDVKNSDSDDDPELEILRDQALKSKLKTDENTATVVETTAVITDEDLVQLRLIALQSAVIKKHQNRLKRKELEELEKQQQDMCIVATETNSNNKNEEDIQPKTDNLTSSTHVTSPICAVVQIDDKTEIINGKINLGTSEEVKTAENSTEVTIEQNAIKSNVEEDEDILRAMLLTSIAKKISKANSKQLKSEENSNTKQETENNKFVTTNENKTKVSVALTENKVITASKPGKSKTAISSQIKESKTTTSVLHENKLALSSAMNGNKVSLPLGTSEKKNIIPAAIKKMPLNLKSKHDINKQVTKPVSRLVINVNSDSDSDGNDTTLKKKITENRKSSTEMFDKSLSLFLKQARSRSETEQHSDISKHLPRSQQIEYRRLKRKLQQLSTKIIPHTKMKGVDENKRIRLSSMTKRNSSKGRPTVPSPTKSNDRMQKNVLIKGNINEHLAVKTNRLQIKGKYEALAPLMAKVTEARQARDTAQADVKKLINELKTARVRLSTTHQNYSVLIQELVKAKAEVDERVNKQDVIEHKKNGTHMCTSTPNKQLHPEISHELSNISSVVNIEEKIIDQDNQVVPMDICPITEQSDVVNEENVGQRVEINSVPENVTNNQHVISKYNSPLDHIQCTSDKYVGNPLTVLCPYDLLGVCRDPACVYRHCGSTGME